MTELEKRIEELKPVFDTEDEPLIDHPSPVDELVNEEPEPETLEPVVEPLAEEPEPETPALVEETKPRIPARYAAKYAEFLKLQEKEKRKTNPKSVVDPPKAAPKQTGDVEMRRVMIAGKWRMVPLQQMKADAPAPVPKKTAYSKLIEEEAVKRMTKNATSIGEIHRIQAKVELPDVDPTKMTIKEIRDLKDQRREQERQEMTKGKRETIVQQIMRDNTKSEFAKLLQIRKLSQGSGYPYRKN